MLKKKSSEQIDIIFEAGEDLFNQQKSSVVMLRQTIIRLPIIRPPLSTVGLRVFRIKSSDFNHWVETQGYAKPETSIMTACQVKVIHTTEFAQMIQNPLKTSLHQLCQTGQFSDVVLNINGEVQEEHLPLHKGILSCRSAKFNGMFSSNLLESTSNVVVILYQKPEIFKQMLQWMYCGQLKFPEDIVDTCDLLLLADEYMIHDLKQKCEEDISSKLNVQNIIQILLFSEKNSSLISNFLVEKSQGLFIEEFDKILKMNPNLESDISKVPGLMTKLFQNIHNKKIKKPRKVHFVVENVDNSPQDTDSDNNSLDYITNYTQHFLN